MESAVRVLGQSGRHPLDHRCAQRGCGRAASRPTQERSARFLESAPPPRARRGLLGGRWRRRGGGGGWVGWDWIGALRPHNHLHTRPASRGFKRLGYHHPHPRRPPPCVMIAPDGRWCGWRGAPQRDGAAGALIQTANRPPRPPSRPPPGRRLAVGPSPHSPPHRRARAGNAPTPPPSPLHLHSPTLP